MTTGHALPTILAATAATLLLAACGGSSGNDPSADQSFEAKRLAFIDCMRKAGLNVKQPTGAGEKGMAVQVPKGVSPARLQTIQRDCARKTGGGPKPPSKAEQARFLDQALKFARCMRAHGIDMPDPQAQGGGIRIGGPAGSRSSGPNSLDPKSPAFQRAQKACESLMPGGKGGAMLSGKGPRTGGGAGGDKPSNDAVVE
jgi:hypothetical protein